MSIAPTASHALSPPTDPVASLSPASDPSAVNAPTSCLNSTDILRGKKAVEIKHNGFTYRLQATRLGKLILTK